MKKLILIVLMVLMLAMANVFGQEIPWGVSKKEVVPEYAYVESNKNIVGERFSFSFDEDRKLNGFSCVFSFRSRAYTLNWFIEKLEELTEKYGKPKIFTDKYSERYKWETNREYIELETLGSTAVVLSFSRK